MAADQLFLGIDLGTSGCRAVVIDRQGKAITEVQVNYPHSIRGNGARVEQAPADWSAALEDAIRIATDNIRKSSVWDTHELRAVAVDGTSGSVLLLDDEGIPVSPALLYNDSRARAQAERIRDCAPSTSAAHGTASGLAKVLWLLDQGYGEKAAWVCHQADWALIHLGANPGISDANSCLKTGFDAIHGHWPDWVYGLLNNMDILPRVLQPGAIAGKVEPALCARWGLPDDMLLVAGTTDSTAAVMATGASEPGTGITSLGSTLVVKLLATTPIFAPADGVYSQPFGNQWLVGGGSNSGGAVLRHFFSDQDLVVLSQRVNPQRDAGLHYYPLLTPGERFPVNDPDLPGRMKPVPQDRALFLQGLLEGMAEIEHLGYQKLHALGGPSLRGVYTVGGGAGNKVWECIRARTLGVNMLTPLHRQAAYGVALLARDGWLARGTDD